MATSSAVTASGGCEEAELPPIDKLTLRTAGNDHSPFSEQARQFFDENYKDCHKKTYRVPPKYLKDLRIENKPGEEYSLLKETDPSKVKGENAEILVLDSLESLLDRKEPMFIISNYKFESYMAKLRDKYKAKTDCIIPKEDGEYDVLLLHLHHGVMIIEVKSIDEEKKSLAKVVTTALKQLERNAATFEDLMKDLNLQITVTPVLALPNTSKEHMLKSKQIVQNITNTFGENALNTFLFKHHMIIKGSDGEEGQRRTLLEWWKSNIEPKKGFVDVETYKKVIERYVGLMSTVEIRTMGDAISEEGYRNMRILLTQDQVDVLNSKETKLVISGPYGTGKTQMLILKARQMIKQGEPVLMVCRQMIRLKDYLIASVKAGMSDEEKQLVHWISLDELMLRPPITWVTHCHVFVDECGDFSKDDPLHLRLLEIFIDSPYLLWFVTLFSDRLEGLPVKRFTSVLRSPKHITEFYNNTEGAEITDEYIKKHKIPYIKHSTHKDKSDTIWRCEQCWRELSDIFEDIGLMRDNCSKESEEQTKKQEETGLESDKYSKESEEQTKKQNAELEILVEGVPKARLTWSDAVLLVNVGLHIDVKAMENMSHRHNIPVNSSQLDVSPTTADCQATLGNINELFVYHTILFVGLERKIIVMAVFPNKENKDDGEFSLMKIKYGASRSTSCVILWEEKSFKPFKIR